MAECGPMKNPGSGQKEPHDGSGTFLARINRWEKTHGNGRGVYPDLSVFIKLDGLTHGSDSHDILEIL